MKAVPYFKKKLQASTIRHCIQRPRELLLAY